MTFVLKCAGAFDNIAQIICDISDLFYIKYCSLIYLIILFLFSINEKYRAAE